MRKKDRIDTVVRCGETNGWNVSADAGQKNGIVIFEFSKFTPAGQNFSFTATMKGKDLYNPQNEMFRLLGTKRSFSQNETFFFSHPYPALFRLISHF